MIVPSDILDSFYWYCYCEEHLIRASTLWLEAYYDKEAYSFTKLRAINLKRLTREPFYSYITEYTKHSTIYWFAIINTVININEPLLYELDDKTPSTSTRLLSNLINYSLLNYISFGTVFSNYKYKTNWHRVLVRLHLISELNETDYFTHEELERLLDKYFPNDKLEAIKYLLELGFLRIIEKEGSAYYLISSKHLLKQFTLIKHWQLKGYYNQFLPKISLPSTGLFKPSYK